MVTLLVGFHSAPNYSQSSLVVQEKCITDGPTDGQSLLKICLDASKKKKKNSPQLISIANTWHARFYPLTDFQFFMLIPQILFKSLNSANTRQDHSLEFPNHPLQTILKAKWSRTNALFSGIETKLSSIKTN